MAQQQQQERQEPRGDGRGQQKAALAQNNLKTLREMFARLSKPLEAALPKFITPERMIRVATTTVQRVPRLLECDPITLVGAVMQSAQLGLEPDNITGSAYLVPFWNSKNNRLECTLIPGYRGLMMLARRTREIQTFDARVVKKGDVFEYEYGSRQFLRHKPAPLTKNPDDVETTAAYMIAFYSGRTEQAAAAQFHVMQLAELEKAKQFTTSRIRFGDHKGEITGPWIEHPDAMRTKTVIRRGSKLLPFSIELMTAVGLEERAIAGKSQNLGALVAEDLGLDFAGTDEGDDEPAEPIAPELLAKLNAGFDALQYSEARRTVKLAEYRGKLEDLAQWLESEVHRGAAGKGGDQAAPAKGEQTPAAKDQANNGKATGDLERAYVGDAGGKSTAEKAAAPEKPAAKPRTSSKVRI